MNNKDIKLNSQKIEKIRDVVDPALEMTLDDAEFEIAQELMDRVAGHYVRIEAKKEHSEKKTSKRRKANKIAAKSRSVNRRK